MFYLEKFKESLVDILGKNNNSFSTFFSIVNLLLLYNIYQRCVERIYYLFKRE